MLKDIRHGLRALARNPLFTLVAVLSLGLGIGVNSTIFSVFNGLLWRPLPVPDADRLVVGATRASDDAFYGGFAYPEVPDYAAAGIFDGVAPYTMAECALGLPGQDEASRIYGEAVGGTFFEVLRPRFILGRGFRPDEGASLGREPVVVLSHRLWQRRFAGDPAVVGRTVSLNAQPFTVVGVTAQEFRGVYAVFFDADFWVPITMLPRLDASYASAMAGREAREFRLIGRLPKGGTIEQGRAAMGTVSARLAAAYPETNRGLKAFLFRELDTRPELGADGAANGVAAMFLAVTGLVLLIACANVANLLLARGAARRKEIAMRAALGASRAQVVRHLLTESVLLSLLAGGVGLGVGAMASDLLGGIQVPTDIPLVLDASTDLRVVLFTIGISLLAGVAFGLLPALRATRLALVPALKDGEGAAPSGRLRFTLGHALVVGQVAASVVLLIVAGLCLKSIGGARTLDPGFRTADRVLVNFSPSLVGYDVERSARFYRQLTDRVRQLPGVRAATIAHYLPLDFSSDGLDIIVEGRAAKPGEEKVQVLCSSVDEHYFEAMGTAIRQGRAFSARDDRAAPPVAIVNETFARTMWPGQNPLGRRLRFDRPDGPMLEVVGVAADGKYRQLTESPRPYVFVPFAQRDNIRVSLLVAHRGDTGGVVAAIRREVKALDPTMPVFDVKTMEQFMGRVMLAPRLSAMLAAPAGILAALIAAIGLYGVMAYSVSRRTREVGIRVAVGAAPADIIKMVMRQGLAMAGVGIAIGLVLALAGTRLIAILLFGVTPTEPVVFVGVPLLLAAVAAVACYVPARRAVRVDPLRALRAE